MQMNLRAASEAVVAGVRARLAISVPPGELASGSVKRCVLPGDGRELTTFICVVRQPSGVQRMFVAEHEHDGERAYKALALPADSSDPTTAKEIARVMMTAILDVARQLAHDPRFKRNVIRVSGASAIRHINGRGR